MAESAFALLDGKLDREPNGGASPGDGDWHGEVAKRSNAADCKSVALAASEVRILPSPPPAFAERSPLAEARPRGRWQTSGVASVRWVASEDRRRQSVPRRRGERSER